MKQPVFVLLFLMFFIVIAPRHAHASGNWTWAGGRTFDSNLDGTLTQGLPGPRHGAVAFTDATGQVYLFGGYGADAAGELGCLNSFWRYDGSKNQWEWLKGCSLANQPGRDAVFWPSSGIPYPELRGLYSIPGARVFPAVTLNKDMNIVGMFGGRGYDLAGNYGLLNDFWYFHPGGTGPWDMTQHGTGVNQKGNYGTRGVPAAANTPGGREGGILLSDSKGQLWILGGEGIDAAGAIGHLNDLWRSDKSTGQWVWVKGASAVNQKGVYGSRGVAAAANTPGGRRGSIAWMDASDRLWLFGGYGYDATGTLGHLNDVWCYDPTTGNWTWVKGNDRACSAGVYGALGVTAAANTPGGRHAAAFWVDASGKVWLFGGSGYDAAGGWGDLNDLWSFDPASGNWTWRKGSNQVNPPGVAGTPGVPAPANTPGGRNLAAYWRDASSGRLFLYGGYHFKSSVDPCQLEDLWSFDPAAGNWTLLKPASAMTCHGSYGLQDVPSKSNIPGARWASATWTDASGRLWLFGGIGLGEAGLSDRYQGDYWLWIGYLDDLWCYDPGTRLWTWVKGNSYVNLPGSWGTKGVAAAGNYPHCRAYATTWVDQAGRLWLFGGQYNTVYFDDLWCFDPATRLWTWVKGSGDLSAPPAVYGTQGVPEPANTPGGRYGASSWVDAAGRLWLFGGNVAPYSFETNNDLWCFDPATKNWTWVKGSKSTADAYAVHGTQGVPAAANTPGGRAHATAWTDKSGRFWLFGGDGKARPWYKGELNDLWCYDPASGNWAWMKGSDLADQPGVRGTQGVPAPANTPSSRLHAHGWADYSGRFWLLGGIDANGKISDELWCFNPASNNWMWVNGSGLGNQPTVYGPKGVASPLNQPGGRADMASWRDHLGRLFFWGGSVPAQNGVSGTPRMDLWYFTESNAVPPGLWNRLE